MADGYASHYTRNDFEADLPLIAAGGRAIRAIRALASYMADLASEGRIVAVEHLGDLRMDLVTVWNAACASGEPNRWVEIAGSWWAPLTYLEMARIRSGDLEDLDAGQVHARIVESVEAGSAMYLTGTPIAHDDEYGNRYRSELRRWKLVVGLSSPGEVHLDPVVGVAPPQVTTVDVHLPTGEVIVSDWIAMAPFTEKTALMPEPDINDPQGRRETTLRQLNENGFVHVYVGNTCPSIIMIGDDLLVGDTGETEDRIPERGVEIGQIATDVNWATIIDRRVLLDILVRGGMSHAEAGEAIDEYVYGNARTIAMKAGGYRLTYTAEQKLGPLLGPDHRANGNGFGPMLLLERLSSNHSTSKIEKSGDMHDARQDGT